MAKPKAKSGDKTKISPKKTTVRELGKAKTGAKRKRILKAKSGAKASSGKLFANLGKEFHPIKMPDNRVGRFFGKRRSFIPKFFKESWAEIKLTTWPNRSETIRLSIAVFIFSIVFGLFVAIIDFGLDKLFKELILKV